MKAWAITPYSDDWCIVVHAETRAKARNKGKALIDDWTEIRAVRLPTLDGEVITNDLLIEAGFPETWEGEPIDFVGYIMECGCDLCAEALRQRHGN